MTSATQSVAQPASSAYKIENKECHIERRITALELIVNYQNSYMDQKQYYRKHVYCLINKKTLQMSIGVTKLPTVRQTLRYILHKPPSSTLLANFRKFRSKDYVLCFIDCKNPEYYFNTLSALTELI